MVSHIHFHDCISIGNNEGIDENEEFLGCMIKMYKTFIININLI
jgi:hypothetical protein